MGHLLVQIHHVHELDPFLRVLHVLLFPYRAFRAEHKAQSALKMLSRSGVSGPDQIIGDVYTESDF